MSFRCSSAFVFGDRVVAGGALVDDNDPILSTHGGYFVKVGQAAAPSGETASTDVPRVVTPEPAPVAESKPEVGAAGAEPEPAKPVRKRASRKTSESTDA